MTKNEFLKKLKDELKGVSESEITDILRDQEEFIHEALLNGRTEESVITSLGDPKELARNLKAEMKIEKATTETQLTKQVSNTFNAAVAIMVLAPFNLIFVLGPLLGLFGVTLAGWAIAFACFATGIALLIAFFTVLLFIPAGILIHLTTFFTFAGILGLSMLGFLVMILITRFIVKMTLSYLTWNLKFIKTQN